MHACVCGYLFDDECKHVRICPECGSNNIKQAIKCPDCGGYFHPDTMVVVPVMEERILVCQDCYDDDYFTFPLKEEHHG